MRSTLLLVAVLYACCDHSQGAEENPLSKKLADNSSKVHNFFDLFPLEKIKEICANHTKNDEGFKAAIVVLQGSEWNNLLGKVLNSSEFAEFDKMMEKVNMSVLAVINSLKAHIMGTQIEGYNDAIKADLKPFMTEVEKTMPVESLIAAIKKEEGFLRNMQNKLSNKESNEIAKKLLNLPELKKMIEIAKRMGLDIETYLGLIFMLLGWVH